MGQVEIAASQMQQQHLDPTVLGGGFDGANRIAHGHRFVEPGEREGIVGCRLGQAIGQIEGQIGQARPRLFDHVRRAVEAAYRGIRPALDQKLGRIARPAADIDDPAREVDRHLGCEITRRPRALVLELQILSGGPVVLL